ncbi:MAG: rhodanese-related sulfurtransferase [Parachlamydia sp.]|nr:rhodanese-related sulfurtransferase [Parachlamydia sp.]
MSYSVLAYYHLTPIADPHAEVSAQKDFLSPLDATSRIYVSEQGINGQMCAAEADAKSYMEWMLSRPEFRDVAFKIHPYHEQVFPRLTIKYRRQLVAFDQEVDMAARAQHLAPEQWKEMLEADDDHLLLDIRNDYEWKLGRFEGAEMPPCETSRDFESYAENLLSRVDPKTKPIMMYCTGGIRCEYYSSILKKKGFEKIYQLQGGVIGYGLKVGSDHWLGKLFVFDDRLSIPISEKKTTVVGECHFCKTASESYYNCANMDCNGLYLCCPDCLEKHAGCCQESCQSAPRLRPYHQQNPHKPFRRWHHYFAEKPSKNEQSGCESGSAA